MRFLLLFLLSVLLSPAQAQESIAGSARELPRFLKRFDVNEDGRIDEEENQAIRDYRRQLRREHRNSIDVNDDGEISATEIQLAREAISLRIREKRQRHFLQIAGPEGELTLEELRAVPGLTGTSEDYLSALFVRLDANQDSLISFPEFLARLR